MSKINLLKDEKVELSNLVKGIVIDGEKKEYSIYKIKLDDLYYNDQNGRIFTKVAEYKLKNNLDNLTKREYNDLFETFIYESNKNKMDKTIKSIKEFGQSEPGVVLSDGRIIDGNRRYTALRKIQKENLNKDVYFLAIILEQDNISEKQIKKLEFNLQHAIEDRVKYDPLNLALEAYENVKEKRLFSVKEYAKDTNQKEKKVIEQIKSIDIVNKYLKYFKKENDYNFLNAKETYSSLFELSKRDSEKYDEKSLGTIFEIIKIKPYNDITRFIRDVFSIVENPNGSYYIEDVNQILKENDESVKKREIVKLTAEYKSNLGKDMVKIKPKKHMKDLENTFNSIKENINSKTKEEYIELVKKIETEIEKIKELL